MPSPGVFQASRARSRALLPETSGLPFERPFLATSTSACEMTTKATFYLWVRSQDDF